jgi:hypothetical protein
MYALGITYLVLVFAATLWGGLVLGPTRLVPFLIFAQTMIMPAGVTLQLPGVPDLDKVTAITLPALLLLVVTKRERWLAYRGAWPDLFLYLFVIWAFFSVLLNNGPYAALSRLLLLMVNMVVPYLAGRLYLRTSEDLFVFVKALLPIVLVHGLFMVLETRLSPFVNNVLFNVWQPAHWRMGFCRPAVLSHGSLELGHYMVLLTVLLLGAQRGWRGLAQPIPRLMPFGILAAFAGTVMSISRGPNMGLALALFTPLFLRNTRWLGLAMAIAGLAFFVWMLGPTITGAEVATMLAGEAASTEGTYSQTVGYRFLQIDAFESMVNEKPLLGWGESFERTGEILIIDGVLLMHTLCYGYPGAVLIIAFWGGVAFFIGRATVRGNTPFAFIGQMLAPVIGWLAFSSWGDSFLRETHLLLMSAVVGALVAEQRLARPLLRPMQRMVFASG